MSRRWLAVSAAVASLALAAPLAASAVGTGASTARATTVKVTAGKPTEFHFTLSKKSVAKGTVTFTIKNGGKLEHDFKIAGKTSKKLKPGKSTTLKVKLKAGKFKFLCTVPGHAAAGMRGTLTVK
jgi:uncharacterized cupredoxin-like copper-binding protein